MPGRPAVLMTGQLQIKGALASIDIIERHPDSAIWAPYTSDHNIVFVSKDNPNTKWVRYGGHFGMPLRPQVHPCH